MDFIPPLEPVNDFLVLRYNDLFGNGNVPRPRACRVAAAHLDDEDQLVSDTVPTL